MRRMPQPDGQAYRRGLVLGLTMAELMLLVVFCLLIALAALLARDRELMEAMTARAEQAEAALAEIGGIESVKERIAGQDPQTIEETWRRLVAAAGTVEQLRDAGIDVAQLVEKREAVKALLPLVGEETAEVAPADAALGAAVRRRLAALGSDTSSPEAVAAALDDVLAARPGKRVDLPPIVTLREDRGYFFETGSAVPSTQFLEQLHGTTIADLVRLIDDYDVDVIEVVGHTDERPVNTGERSNLDAALLEVVRGGPVETLTAADNAGLGLARAVAVARELKADPRLAGREILPMSAAQLIDTDGRLTSGTFIGDVKERRRIEIRLRRADERTGRS